jgi:hypothetical protein
MSLLTNMARGLRSLFRREQMDEELDEEVRTYLAMAVRAAARIASMEP